ncbi:MAG TPA: PAS domain S-box protein [Opitutus sp.]|nr:PAS domain S-box protein [Opitutus sp.]
MRRTAVWLLRGVFAAPATGLAAGIGAPGLMTPGLGWGVVAVLALGGAGAATWAWRRWRRSTRAAREFMAMVRSSECMLWHAEVTLAGEDIRWTFSMQDSAMARRLFGSRFPRGGSELWSLLDVPELPEMNARSTAALRAGLPDYEQQFHFRENGRDIWLAERVSITPHGPNRFRLVGLITDITTQHEAEIARQEAEDLRRRTEAQLQQVLERANCMIWHANVKRTSDGFTWKMEAPRSVLYRKLFGDVQGAFDWARLDVPERLEMNARCEQALRSGASGYEQEFQVVRPGELIRLHEVVTITALSAEDLRLVGVITDITAQREAERARHMSESRLEQALGLADFLLWHARVRENENGVLVWELDVPKSTLFQRLFGRAATGADEFMPWRDFVNPAVYDEMVERADRAIRAGADSYEQEVCGRLGTEEIRVHEHATIRSVGRGEWQLVGVVTDVTDRHRAEEARQSSERALREIMERADCLLWRAAVERQGDRLVWTHFNRPNSRLSVELLGRHRDAESSMLWDPARVPDLQEMNRRSDEAMLSGASGYEQEFRVLSQDRVLWLRESVSVETVGPDQWRLVGVITDITRQRQAEDARRATEAQLQRIMGLADCMVWEAMVADRSGQGLAWEFYTPRSVLFRRLFGHEATETGVHWLRLNVPEFDEMTERATRAIRGGHEGYQQEFRVIQDRRVIWLREMVKIVPLEPGRWQLVGVVTDISAQREAQEARKASEAQLEQMLATADCLLWQARVFNETGSAGAAKQRWVMFIPRSRLFRQIFGRDPDDPATLPWLEVLDPETARSNDVRAWRALTAGRDSYEQEFRAQRGEAVFWLHEHVSVVQVGPAEWKLVGVITDLTARREAEQAMLASEERYRTLYQHTPVAIIEADFSEVGRRMQALRQEGVRDLAIRLDAPGELLDMLKRTRFVDCNGAALQILRAKGKADFRWRRGLLATPETLVVAKRTLLRLWQAENTHESELRIRDFEGRVHDMHLRWWIDRTDEGLSLSRAVMVLVDLTELKHAEAALAAEKERLAVTLRAMAEGVITTDVDGGILFINSAAATLVGIEAKAAIGRPIQAICAFASEGTGEPVEVPVLAVTRRDVVIDIPPRTRLTGRGGVIRLVEGCCAPVHAADSRVIGTVLVFRDVTEQDRLEQELLRASKLESVGVLAGGIAHDFNNILTAVMGNVALAALDVPPDGDAGRSLREAEKATLRARDLTQQLLTFSKGGEPIRTAVQLDTIVREMTTFALHGSRVKPAFDFPDDLWPADADKGQIGRVVQNLVLNAVQAMPEGGMVRIALNNETVDGFSRLALAPGAYVHIAITDTGVGIRPEHLPQIFDPYFTTKQTGSGLGLAAVYSIVQKHRGAVDVSSQLGVGTTFRIWLPAKVGERSGSGEASGPIQPARFRGRVLFMDDEESIRQMASFLLRRFGLEVVCVADGADAVRRYREARDAGEPFALVIMDLTVPGGMGGREALSHLQQIDEGVRAIVSSGYSSDPVLANHRAHGFCGMVAKPYDVDDLARVLREALAAQTV